MLDEELPPGPNRGDWRIRSYADTIEACRPLMKEAGVTRVADLTHLDRIGLPVFAAYRPNAKTYTIQQGKGLTRDAAMASAMMEALEMHFAENPQVETVTATWNELRRTRDVIDCDRLPKPPDSPFHEDLPIEWVEGLELRSRRPIMVPYEVVVAAGVEPSINPGCFEQTNAGLAAGNHPLEAALHGILEIIERKALSRWTRLRPDEIRSRQVDPGPKTLANAHAVSSRVLSIGLQLLLSQLSSSTNLPVYQASFVDPRLDDPDLWHAGNGSGCHISHEIAVRRSLTEAGQSRITMLAGLRETDSDQSYESAERRAVSQLLNRNSSMDQPSTNADVSLSNFMSFGFINHFLSEFYSIVIVELYSDAVSVGRILAPSCRRSCCEDADLASARQRPK